MEIVYKYLQITDFRQIYFGGFLPPKTEKRRLCMDPGTGRTGRIAESEFGREIGKIPKKSFEIRQISPFRAVY